MKLTRKNVKKLVTILSAALVIIASFATSFVAFADTSDWKENLMSKGNIVLTDAAGNQARFSSGDLDIIADKIDSNDTNISTRINGIVANLETTTNTANTNSASIASIREELAGLDASLTYLINEYNLTKADIDNMSDIINEVINSISIMEEFINICLNSDDEEISDLANNPIIQNFITDITNLKQAIEYLESIKEGASSEELSEAVAKVVSLTKNCIESYKNALELLEEMKRLMAEKGEDMSMYDFSSFEESLRVLQATLNNYKNLTYVSAAEYEKRVGEIYGAIAGLESKLDSFSHQVDNDNANQNEQIDNLKNALEEIKIKIITLESADPYGQEISNINTRIDEHDDILADHAKKLKNALGAMADEYDSTKSYRIGDIVIKNGILFQATEDIESGEDFDTALAAGKWRQINLSTIINHIENGAGYTRAVLTKVQNSDEDNKEEKYEIVMTGASYE